MISRRELLALAAAAPLAAGSGPLDPHRPQYHFLPARNWMNDPNGLVWHEGKYHLFYQYNPGAAVWGDMHWGHAESTDLIHWKHLPIALAPVPGGYDKDGVFSGCCRIYNGVPTIFYTGVSPETQNVITCNSTLTEFKRYEHNPVIAGPPDGMSVTAFRDPCVWREGKEYRMVIGAGRKGGNGMALLYSSPDLFHWTYLHPLASAASRDDGEIWECPNFFPFGKKWFLCISSTAPVRVPYYWTGNYENLRFSAEGERRMLDYGGYYYAPQAFVDAHQRLVIFGWIPEGRTESEQKAAGWAGVQSLPRVLDLAPGGGVAMKPLPELTALRGRRFSVQELRGDSLEILAEFPRGKAAGLHVRMSPDRREQTTIAFDPAGGALTIDRRHASLNANTDRDIRNVPLDLPASEPLRLHVFLDRSLIEIYVNDRVCASTRVYPTRPDAVDVEVIGSPAAFDAWEMKPAMLA